MFGDTGGNQEQAVAGSARVHRKIVSTTIIIAGISLLVKVVAMVKELVVAQQFGVGDALDSFLIAFMIPSFIIQLISGSLNNAMIPTYIEVREGEGRRESIELLHSVQFITFIVLLVITILLIILAPILIQIVYPHFTERQLLLTEHLLELLSTLIFITGIQVLWSAVLNAGERFVATSFVPLITPFLVVMGLVFIHGIGVFSYAISWVVAASAETAVLGLFVWKAGIPLVPKWYGLSPWVKQVLSQYTPMAAGTLLLSSSTVIDQAMASSLGTGSISELSYGSKLVSVGLGIGSMAIGTAVLPHVSKLVAKRDWVSLKKTYWFCFILVVAAAIPATAIFILFSRPLIHLLFEHGTFVSADVVPVSHVQILLSLQVPFYMLNIVAVRLIEALKGSHVFVLGNLISASVNIGMNFVLMHSMGVSGIALSTSIVYCVSFIHLFIRLQYLVRRASLV